MSDIRLEEIPFEFDGKQFKLRCNMNVLADVQEAFDGEISTALSGKAPLKSVVEFLAAMLNDYADEMGWPERYTSKELGRRFTFGTIPRTEIMGLVSRAMTPPKEDETPDVSEPDTEDRGN